MRIEFIYKDQTPIKFQKWSTKNSWLTKKRSKQTAQLQGTHLMNQQWWTYSCLLALIFSEIHNSREKSRIFLIGNLSSLFVQIDPFINISDWFSLHGPLISSSLIEYEKQYQHYNPCHPPQSNQQIIINQSYLWNIITSV